jgi:hypothetical protein
MLHVLPEEWSLTLHRFEGPDDLAPGPAATRPADAPVWTAPPVGLADTRFVDDTASDQILSNRDHSGRPDRQARGRTLGADDFSQPSPFRQESDRCLWDRPDPITHQHAEVAAIKMVSWLEPMSRGGEKIFARTPNQNFIMCRKRCIG